jgi:hypothetical protein
MNLVDKIDWTIRIVYPGQNYGMDFRLINNDGPLVEFYDQRSDHTPLGQFVTRYRVKTLMERYDDTSNNGLNLDGNIHEWVLSNFAYAEVIDWLKELFPPEAS